MRQPPWTIFIATATVLTAALIYAAAPGINAVPTEPPLPTSAYPRDANHTAMAVLQVRWANLTTDAKLFSSPNAIGAIKYEIAGTDAVSRTVDGLGLVDFLPKQNDGTLFQEGKQVRQQIINMIKSGIEIELDRTGEYSSLLYIKLSHPNAAQAPRIVNRLVDIFIDRRNADADKDYKQTIASTEASLNQSSQLIKTLDIKMLNLELANPGIRPDTPDSPEHVTARLDTSITAARRQRDLAIAKIQRLTELIRGSVGLTPLEQSATDAVATEIARLQGEADFAQNELNQLESDIVRHKQIRTATITARKQLRGLSTELQDARRRHEALQTRQQELATEEESNSHGIQFRLLERAAEL